jgi:hypothetical protein
VTVPLPIPDDPRIASALDPGAWAEAWADKPFPRSAWLKAVEEILREHYPQASSNELTLTARNLAPFPLALPNVP